MGKSMGKRRPQLSIEPVHPAWNPPDQRLAETRVKVHAFNPTVSGDLVSETWCKLRGAALLLSSHRPARSVGSICSYGTPRSQRVRVTLRAPPQARGLPGSVCVHRLLRVEAGSCASRAAKTSTIPAIVVWPLIAGWAVSGWEK
jgi:hypothetical protein